MTRRYLTAQSDLWRAASTPVAILGVALISVFVWMWVPDSQAEPANLIPVTIIGFLLILPRIVAFLKREYLQVDLETRQAAFFSKGREQWKCSLDELGPLRFRKGYRARGNQATSGDSRGGTSYFHVVCGGRPDLALCETYDYPKARFWAERVARDWRVGLETMDGQHHAPDEPEGPRLHTSAAGAQGQKLSAESGVTVEVMDGITTLRSSLAPRFGEFPNWLLLGGVGMGVAALGDVGIAGVLEDPLFDPGRTAMAFIAALLVVGFGARFLIETKTFISSANVITIDGTHVRYRRQAIPLGSVKEVTYADGLVILARKKRIEIHPDFCKRAEAPSFVAELRRLIVAGAQPV